MSIENASAGFDFLRSAVHNVGSGPVALEAVHPSGGCLPGEEDHSDWHTGYRNQVVGRDTEVGLEKCFDALVDQDKWIVGLVEGLQVDTRLNTEVDEDLRAGVREGS